MGSVWLALRALGKGVEPQMGGSLKPGPHSALEICFAFLLLFETVGQVSHPPVMQLDEQVHPGADSGPSS